MTAPARAALRAVESSDVVVEGPQWPRVPDAQYRAVLLGHETIALAAFRNSPKVMLRFRIVDPGEQLGAVLFRAYRVAKILGKPRTDGAFVLRRRSELFLDLRAIAGTSRPDRISLRALHGAVLRISTRTVAVDYRQRRLPEDDRYSVVAKLIELETEPPGREPLP
jgi:hypothetical protein